jgi:glycosyltransferase involved in cell wall biosynthesis
MKIVVPQKDLHVASNTRGIGVYSRQLSTALLKYFPGDTISTSGTGDLIHYHFFDPFARTLHIDHTIPTIVTVHDLIPLKFPTHFPVGLRGKINWFFQLRALRQASHIITDSESSKADISKIAGIAEERITVVPLGPNHTQKIGIGISDKIASGYNLPKKYLLYVGDINWNKNVVGLIKAFSEVSDHNLSLVLVGKVFSDKPNIPEYQAIEKAIAKSGVSERIMQLGFVPSHHLSVLYARAILYVQPSWYEGFGLPILEAMKHGCPVASSNRGSLKEVGGEAVAYFNPSADMTETISQLLKNPAKRQELSLLGRARAKEFTWEKSARATHAVYEQILSRPR